MTIFFEMGTNRNADTIMMMVTLKVPDVGADQTSVLE